MTRTPNDQFPHLTAHRVGNVVTITCENIRDRFLNLYRAPINNSVFSFILELVEDDLPYQEVISGNVKYKAAFTDIEGSVNVFEVNTTTTPPYVEFELVGDTTITTDLETYEVSWGSDLVDIPILELGNLQSGSYSQSRFSKEDSGSTLEGTTYFSFDSSLHGSLTNTELTLHETTDEEVFYDETLMQSWESGSKVGGGGVILEDHDGNLRLYYYLRNVAGQSGVNGCALMISTDKGATFQRVKENGYPEIVDDPDSNLIKIEPPIGADHGSQSEGPIVYDPDAPINKRYKMLQKFGGLDGVYLGISKEGKSFYNFTKVLDAGAGDDSYTTMFKDTNTNEVNIYGRGRTISGTIPESGPPEPYNDRRYVIRAKSSNFDDYPYDSEGITVIDPATEWSYGDEADSAGFWSSVSDSCGDTWTPSTPANSKIRPDIYRGTVSYHKGYYIGAFPVFFRDDDRVPYGSPDRTTGPLYPVFSYSKDGVTWTFPDNNKSMVDISYYEVLQDGECHTINGNEDVGQVQSAFGTEYHGDKVFLGVMHNHKNHYEPEPSSTIPQRRYILQTLREDGFTSINATNEGTWITNTLTVPNNCLWLILNGKGSIDVEILDTDDNPIEGFTRDDFVSFSGDKVKHVCQWTNSIETLQGQDIKLKFYMTNADVFSFTFGV